MTQSYLLCLALLMEGIMHGPRGRTQVLPRGQCPMLQCVGFFF